MPKGFVNSEEIDARAEAGLLRRWVELSSASHERAGVEKMQSEVSDELSAVGLICQLLPDSNGKFPAFLKAEIPGEKSEFITMICHTDTVLPSNGWKLSEDGLLAFGSGAIDNKGGLVVLVSALKRYLERKPRLKYGLRVLCSPNEEVGSAGFISVYGDHASDTLFALGFEPALSNGSIICKRRGNRWYDIEVMGREAHAGRSRGEHVNAAHDLAKKIVALSKLNNRKQEIAVNVGHFEGGQDRFNIICGFAKAKLDVRFATLQQRDRLHRKIISILKRSHEYSADRKHKSETTFKIVDDCPPFSPTRTAIKLSKSYLKTVGLLEGRSIAAEFAGGAGDVNYLSRKGVVVLDGFGPVGGEMHTRREFVEIRTLATRAIAMAEFLGEIQKY